MDIIDLEILAIIMVLLIMQKNTSIIIKADNNTAFNTYNNIIKENPNVEMI